MITSIKGKEMIATVSQIYSNNRTMLAIFQAIGNEADLSEELTSDISKQMFVQTATWGLEYWEKAVGIVTNKEDTLSNRRTRILTKMQTRYPITPNRIKRILETATNQVVRIMQNVADYTFEVNFDLVNNFNIKKAIETLDEIKPAHLSYILNLNVKQINPDIRINTGMALGEVIIINPFSPKDLTIDFKAYIASSIVSETENITVYPKEA